MVAVHRKEVTEHSAEWSRGGGRARRMERTNGSRRFQTEGSVAKAKGTGAK